MMHFYKKTLDKRHFGDIIVKDNKADSMQLISPCVLSARVNITKTQVYCAIIAWIS